MPTLLDVVKSAPWRCALFTTYALSLSFFESIILRALRQGGCQDIWVVADVNGYRNSLIERKSGAVGQDYRLIPVRLPNGVFHAKCAYLMGEGADALVVGSGNLTFGGFGRNLEVIESFTSQSAPGVFADFAGFLAALGGRADDTLQCADRSWMEKFRERSTAVSGEASPTRSPKLLHCVSSAIIEGIAQSLTAADELTVMSPFIDPDGKGIRELAQRVSCKQLHVAVPPRASESNFPFAKAKTWKVAVDAVWAEGEDRKRPLHAKWLEFRTKRETIVVTGSTNATYQALCTTNNVEVSVLRSAPRGHVWAVWTASEVPSQFVPSEFWRSTGGELVAHASLDTAGHLSGSVLGAGVPQGSWRGSLVKPSGVVLAFQVDVDAAGRFQLTSRDFAQFALSSGTQVLLQHGDTTARGWVHIEDILRMVRHPGLNLPALVRAIARENTEDDDVALLEYLAINANAHLPTFAKKITAVTHTSVRDKNSVIVVDLEELAPREVPTGSEKPQDHLATLSLDRVFAQLRRRLLGDGRPEEGPEPSALRPSPDDADEDDDQSPAGGQPRARLADAITLFYHEMYRLTEEPTLSADDRSAVFVMWFEVTLSMLLIRRGDVEEAWRFLREWTALAARLVRTKADVGALEQHLITSIAALALHAPKEQSLSDLHELLESFYAGPASSSRTDSALLPAAGIPFGLLLNGENVGTLRTAISRVLADKTIREHVVSLLEGIQRRGEIDESLPIFDGDAGQDILEHLRQQGSRARFKEQSGQEPICGNCFVYFPERMGAYLLSRRIAHCEHCNWFTARSKR